MAFLSTGLAAQQAGPAFDAVSIKQNTSGAPTSSIGLPNGLAFNMTNMPMLAAITSAFPLKNRDIAGAPDWLRSDRWDIAAKSAGSASSDQVRAMLQTMLKDRLKLSARIERRDTPVFAMVVDKPGHPGLVRTRVDCDAVRAARETAARTGAPPAPSGGPTVAPPCGYTWSTAIFAGGITMETLADSLDRVAGRIVVDRTGLDGRYEFTLRFARTGSPSTGPDDPPELFTALREQLGLRLEPTRAPIDTLVIEHIERPEAD